MAIQLAKTNPTPSLAPSAAPSVAASLTPSATLVTSEVVNIQNSPESPQTTQPNLIQRATSAMIRSPSCIGIVTRTLIRGTVGFLSGFTIGATYGAGRIASAQHTDLFASPLGADKQKLDSEIAFAQKNGFLCVDSLAFHHSTIKKTKDGLYNTTAEHKDCPGHPQDLYNTYVIHGLNISNAAIGFGLFGGVTGAIIATVMPLLRAIRSDKPTLLLEESSQVMEQVAIESDVSTNNVAPQIENENQFESNLLEIERLKAQNEKNENQLAQKQGMLIESEIELGRLKQQTQRQEETIFSLEEKLRQTQLALEKQEQNLANSQELQNKKIKALEAAIVLPVEAEAAIVLPVEAEAAIVLPVEAEAAIVLPVEAEAAIVLPVESEAAIVLPVEAEAAIVLPVESEAAIALPVEAEKLIEELTTTAQTSLKEDLVNILGEYGNNPQGTNSKLIDIRAALDGARRRLSELDASPNIDKTSTVYVDARNGLIALQLQEVTLEGLIATHQLDDLNNQTDDTVERRALLGKLCDYLNRQNNTLQELRIICIQTGWYDLLPLLDAQISSNRDLRKMLEGMKSARVIATQGIGTSRYLTPSEVAVSSSATMFVTRLNELLKTCGETVSATRQNQNWLTELKSHALTESREKVWPQPTFSSSTEKSGNL